MEDAKDPERDRLVQVLTTEHFTLQTARSSTVSETNGRATLYLGTLSSSIVALALVAQVSRAGAPFFGFAFVLLPLVFFLGVVTFARVLQSTGEWMVYSLSINRIRRFYTEITPESARYFIIQPTDDPGATLRGMSISSRWQRFLTMAGTIAVINSLVAAVFVGLAVGLLVDRGLRADPAVVLAASSGVGLVVLVVSAALFFSYQDRRFAETDRRMTVLFPEERSEERADGA
jgi:hypothetical protein